MMNGPEENPLAILPVTVPRQPDLGHIIHERRRHSCVGTRIVIMQMLSVAGALMVLAAYGLIQSGIWRELNPGYLALNIVGSLLLGIVAVAERQAGFILLEFAWVGLGLIGVVRAWKARRPARLPA
jgi:hypothetical protein